MSNTEPRTHNLFDLIPNFTGNWIKITNLIFIALLIIGAIWHIQFHRGYATVPILGAGVAAVFYVIALANPESDDYGIYMTLALASAFLAVTTPFWYVHGVIPFLIVVIIAVLLLTLIIFELMPANDTTFAVLVCLLVIPLGYTGYTIPGEVVSKRHDGIYTYHTSPVPLGFLWGTYDAYYVLSTGSVKITGLPAEWTVVDASFDLTRIQHELDSDTFQKVITAMENPTATSTRLNVTLPESVNFTSAENPALFLQQWLQEEYGQIPMEVSVTRSRKWTTQ